MKNKGFILQDCLLALITITIFLRIVSELITIIHKYDDLTKTILEQINDK